MTTSWVPFSAAALVTGALALLVGALLMPVTGEDTAAALEVVREQDGRWLAVALMFFGGGLGLLLGVPSCFMLFRLRGRWVGMAGVAVTAVAGAGTAGYAMLLIFFRALVREDAVVPEAFDEVVADPGLNVFLYGWVVSFYLGELLLAVAVLRSGAVARWIPGLLLAHVVSWPVSLLLPEDLRSATVVLTVFAFAGLAFGAVAESQRVVASTAPSSSESPLALG